MPGQRWNEIRIQQLSQRVYDQVFPKPSGIKPNEELVKLSQKHLTEHELYGKNTDNTKPIEFELPKLEGDSLDAHFYRLGVDAAYPYLDLATEFAEISSIPPLPEKWIRKPGWTRYVEGEEPMAVDAPLENMLVFDVETLYKISPFSVMACAASPTAWYSWLSPWLVEGGLQAEDRGATESGIQAVTKTQAEGISDRQLIPLGDPTVERVIIGHNIGYDRARIKEEYHIKQTKNAFMDTMSLHVAVNGMCSRQRPAWLKYRKERLKREGVLEDVTEADSAFIQQISSEGPDIEGFEGWIVRSSINSLKEVAEFHCNIVVDKTVRQHQVTFFRQGAEDR